MMGMHQAHGGAVQNIAASEYHHNNQSGSVVQEIVATGTNVNGVIIHYAQCSSLGGNSEAGLFVGTTAAAGTSPHLVAQPALLMACAGNCGALPNSVFVPAGKAVFAAFRSFAFATVFYEVI